MELDGQNYYHFSATDNVGPGQVFDFQFSGGNSSYRVLDVTDPLNVSLVSSSLNGSNLSFAVAADSTKQFVAYTSIGFKRPTGAKLIQNQNLHGLTQAEFLIITHPDFWVDANRLAEFHRSHYGHSVNVVRIGDVFNEFSSGAVDPTAIRDFAKMFYDRGQNTSSPFRYLLLFGDGSYDYKAIQTAAGTNYIPTYQSRRSQLPTHSYTSDDYYGFLDDGEGFWGEQAHNRDNETIPLFLAEGDTVLVDHGLDIGVGRFPAANAAEAKAIVDKIISYHQDANGYGSWRNRVVLVADHKDDDTDTHVRQADGYTTQIEASSPCTNIDKIYMDNYVMENQASGDRFPDGKAALLKALDEGSLIVNYTGHGGEVGWSNAQILDISDINKISNDTRLPAYITATCEFGRWDDPDRKSGAEVLLTRDGGGSVAMFTTVRVVFSGPNHTLNTNYYNNVFTFDSAMGRMLTMGEVFERTKNASWGGSVNNRNFSMLGDPAMILAYPHHRAVVTSINGNPVITNVVDTLSALNLVTISGEVRDPQGNLLNTYNGDLSAIVYDKPSKFTTRRYPFDFIWRKNKVFRGSSTVQNGLFSFEFVVPIDISYEDNLPDLNGKISLYFHNTTSDGGGCSENIFIGGTDSAAISDNRPPDMDLFMNDIKFADGGLVGQDATLIAEIFDENGINTVGTGIGHELTAVLDDDESEVFVLNDFYEANKNSYQEGTIRYPFKDLSVGEHNLRVKVWDVANNNSREGEVNFIVADDANMALGHVVNYPNPFTTNTKFFIEHNRNGNALKVLIKIYTVGGKVVKTLEDNFFAEGNLYCDLEWDGLDDYGDAIGRGVYVYEVVVKDETTGERISTFEKLVVLR
ncbi:MAG: type IX secretion system sortase PorU [Bacteroidia bacterium]